MPGSKTIYTEPGYVQMQDKGQVPFWRTTIAENTPLERRPTDLAEQTHQLLETYSGVPREEHDDHIHRTRNRLWQIRQYPCTGLGGWLKPQMCLSTVYPEILDRVKAGQTVVDIGTFIGHDLRRLVVDGAPSDRLWGVDIVNHFDVGFDFFKDRERWQGKFIEADFLTVQTNPALGRLRANTNIIFIASVLHQWDWPGQTRGVTALMRFTKPGSLIAGLQMGKPIAGDVVAPGLNIPLYIHTPESFTELWEEVGRLTSTRWEVQAWPRPWEWIGASTADMAWMGSDVQLLEFAVCRMV